MSFGVPTIRIPRGSGFRAHSLNLVHGDPVHYIFEFRTLVRDDHGFKKNLACLGLHNYVALVMSL
jgi:hypothetical protein